MGRWKNQKWGAQAQTHQQDVLVQWFVDTTDFFSDTTVFTIRKFEFRTNEKKIYRAINLPNRNIHTLNLRQTLPEYLRTILNEFEALKIWLMDQSYLRIMIKVSYQLQPYSTQSETQLLQIRIFYILENKSKVDILGFILSLVTFGRYLMEIGDRKRLIYYCFFVLKNSSSIQNWRFWRLRLSPIFLGVIGFEGSLIIKYDTTGMISSNQELNYSESVCW